MTTDYKPGCCVDHAPKGANACEGEHASKCMRLPDGTCGDCAHLVRCTTIFGASKENTSCGFWPRRFRARRVSAELAS